MARKQTYRQRYTTNIIEAGGEKPAKKSSIPRPKINEKLQQSYIDGKMLLIDKPLHWTSFDVVRKLRSLLQIKKIGHAGTLDPLATGLLIVCTGKFTKKINEYMAAEKEYTGSITLGAVTPSYDLETEPEQHKDYSFVTPAMLEETKHKFIGALQQLPPVYSAIKKNGVALYELARKGVDVKIEPRSITIFEFDITEINLPVVNFRVTCSSGTYIRSLANDFGVAIGCGGYLSSLRRTKIGDIDVKDGLGVEQFEKMIANKNETKTAG